MLIDNCDATWYFISMNDIQEMLSQLREKGWTWAAIADELDTHRETVSRWWSCQYYPDHPKMVVAALQDLLRRRAVPKRKRYKQIPQAS